MPISRRNLDLYNSLSFFLFIPSHSLFRRTDYIVAIIWGWCHSTWGLLVSAAANFESLLVSSSVICSTAQVFALRITTFWYSIWMENHNSSQEIRTNWPTQPHARSAALSDASVESQVYAIQTPNHSMITQWYTLILYSWKAGPWPTAKPKKFCCFVVLANGLRS